MAAAAACLRASRFSVHQQLDPGKENDIATEISRVEYFYCTVQNRPGEAHSLLSSLASTGVNLLAFSAVPVSRHETRLMLFPEKSEQLAKVASMEGLQLDGPQHALMVRGDDELGAIARIHERLANNRINVSAASGITDGKGGYGYILYVSADDINSASLALGV
jgi:hypothetical protein